MACLFEPANELCQGNTNGFANLLKLDKIKAPLAGLILAHEGLGQTEPLCQICLAEFGIQSDLPKKMLQPLMVLRKDAFGHAKIIDWLDIYPILGYDVKRAMR